MSWRDCRKINPDINGHESGAGNQKRMIFSFAGDCLKEHQQIPEATDTTVTEG